MKNNDQNMTSGRILPQLILFALPLLGSSLVQQLYNTADLLFVGNFAGKTAAAAVGSSGLIFTCLIGLFTGISVGVGIVIAHAWGAGKKDEALETAQTAMIIGIAGSMILMILGILGTEKILVLMQTPKSVLREASTYVRIYFLSMMPMVVYNMGASILRASGNSKVPFYILIAGGITNILADALFVAILPYGVVGAAAATSISQTVSAVCMLWYLMKGRSNNLPLTLQGAHIQGRLVGKILNYGLPAGIQSIVVTLSNVVVQYYINGYGEDAVAAYAAYFKIEGMLYLPIMSFGQAITTFVGQNYGAGKYVRIRKGTLLSAVIGCGVTIAGAVLVLLVPESVVRLFIQDDMVVAYGVSILLTTFPLYWIYAILEVAGGALRGMGYSQISMIMVMWGLCGLRIMLLFMINKLNCGFSAVAKVYPITWSVTAAGFVFIFIIVMMRKKVQYKR